MSHVTNTSSMDVKCCGSNMKVMAGVVVILLCSALGCSADNPAQSDPHEHNIIVSQGEISGAQLFVPECTCNGGEVALNFGDELIEPADKVDDLAVLSVMGPAVELRPGGWEYAVPVTVKIPFSTAAFNDLETTQKGLAVLVRIGDNSPIQIDVGPITVSKIEIDVGPIKVAGDSATGEVWIQKNETGDTNDAVLEFQVMRFGSYQVVALDTCETDCDER